MIFHNLNTYYPNLRDPNKHRVEHFCIYSSDPYIIKMTPITMLKLKFACCNFFRVVCIPRGDKEIPVGKKDDYEPNYELTDEDREACAAEQYEEEHELVPRRNRKPHVKFFDAYICYQKGEWGMIPEELRKQYVMILRRSAAENTFSTSATRDNARAILSALGIPLESEKTQKARAREIAGPLPPEVNEWVERSRRKLVDRQKRLMVEKIEKSVYTGFVSVLTPGPYQEQAIKELVEEGKATLLADEMVQIEKGRPPVDGSGRRKRRVVRIGAPLAADVAPAVPGPLLAEPAPVPPPEPPAPAGEEDDLI